jgi:hypothetical protein
MHDQLQLLAAILACWQRPVASTKALDLFHWAMHAVFFRHTTAANKMACKNGSFFCCCFVCCCPGSRWGNTERVVTRWRLQCPVASEVALDMSHWVMLSVLLWCTAMAIELAGG